MQSFFQKIDDKEKWQQLLTRVLFKTFFHTLEWESFLEKEYDWLRFERYLYKDEALLSLARYKRDGKEYLISHPFCEYGGPLPLKEKIDGKDFQKDLFLQFQEPLRISFHPYLLGFFVHKAKSEIGLPAGERESFFFEDLDKKDINEIWQRCLDRNRRRSITKAEESGIEIVECKSEDELKELYRFYVESLKRHQALVYPFSFFKFFFQSPASKILLAKIGEMTLGGNIFLFYNGTVHSFLCGFNVKCKDLGVHSLLLWQVIKRSQRQGYSTFDFGATKKDSPLRSFKQRWGAQCLPIHEIRKDYPPKRGLKQGFLRKIWGILPTSLVQLLSPYLIKHKL